MTTHRATEVGLPTDPSWDEAFVRVESYLHAHHIESGLLLTRLATGILEEARRRAASGVAGDPVTIAMGVLQDRMKEWFAHVLPDREADESTHARCRLALILAEVPRRWPEQFLSKDPAPPELIRAASESSLQPGPELRLTAMPPALIEFAIGDAVNTTWKTFSRHRFFRASAAWILIAGALGAVWAASH